MSGRGDIASRARWLELEIRHLEALDAVARHGSFTAAADALGYVQSAVSQQIEYLERTLGEQLVQRGNAATPLALTPAGKLVCAHGYKIVQRVQQASAELRQLEQTAGEPLLIGAHAGAGDTFTEEIFERLTVRTGVGMASLTPGGDELCGKLQRGELDAVLMELPMSWGPFSALEARSEPFALLLPAAWRSCPDGKLRSLRDLAGLHLVERADCRGAAALKSRLRKLGVEAHWHFQVTSTVAARALVQAGAAAAVLPHREAAADESAGRIVEVGSFLPSRTVGAVWHRSRDHDSRLDPLRSAARELMTEHRRLAA